MQVYEVTETLSSVNQLAEIKLPTDMTEMVSASKLPLEIGLPLPMGSALYGMIRYKSGIGVDTYQLTTPKISIDEFLEFYRNLPTTDGFSAYSFDGWMIFTTSAARALKTAKPGTVEFRKALRDEILNTKELSGVHAVYNFKPGAYYGVDERALVIVRLKNGAWTYEP